MNSNHLLQHPIQHFLLLINRHLEGVVKDRFDRLLAEVQRIAGEMCAVHQGTVQTVLVESVNEHDPELMTGRLSNNLLVHFPGDESMIGKMVDVSLDECRGFYYIGRKI